MIPSITEDAEQRDETDGGRNAEQNAREKKTEYAAGHPAIGMTLHGEQRIDQRSKLISRSSAISPRR